MRTPAPRRSTPRADPDVVHGQCAPPDGGVKVVRPRLRLRALHLDPTVFAGAPSLKTTPTISGASGAEEPPTRQPHRLTTHCSFTHEGGNVNNGPLERRTGAMVRPVVDGRRASLSRAVFCWWWVAPDVVREAGLVSQSAHAHPVLGRRRTMLSGSGCSVRDTACRKFRRPRKSSSSPDDPTSSRRSRRCCVDVAQDVKAAGQQPPGDGGGGNVASPTGRDLLERGRVRRFALGDLGGLTEHPAQRRRSHLRHRSVTHGGV